ncbi:hypothetical protein [Bradyrhizobium sp. I71]|uniref:hypothetical protein n=1 Tax=Bradyrhizobium sp. I71 TaxID=2590772 RepID=UPI001EF877C2|nr:hypothetical protein [Bradyrhizobium sp. I71]ULK97710.1 hypothetical protein FJV43_34320 [Bradyrhizobium sp. I71]
MVEMLGHRRLLRNGFVLVQSRGSSEEQVRERIFDGLARLRLPDGRKMPVDLAKASFRVNGNSGIQHVHRAAGKRGRRTKRGRGGDEQGDRKESAT